MALALFVHISWLAKAKKCRACESWNTKNHKHSAAFDTANCESKFNSDSAVAIVESYTWDKVVEVENDWPWAWARSVNRRQSEVQVDRRHNQPSHQCLQTAQNAAESIENSPINLKQAKLQHMYSARSSQNLTRVGWSQRQTYKPPNCKSPALSHPTANPRQSCSGVRSPNELMFSAVLCSAKRFGSLLAWKQRRFSCNYRYKKPLNSLHVNFEIKVALGKHTIV